MTWIQWGYIFTEYLVRKCCFRVLYPSARRATNRQRTRMIKLIFFVLFCCFCTSATSLLQKRERHTQQTHKPTGANTVEESIFRESDIWSDAKEPLIVASPSPLTKVPHFGRPKSPAVQREFNSFGTVSGPPPSSLRFRQRDAAVYKLNQKQAKELLNDDRRPASLHSSPSLTPQSQIQDQTSINHDSLQLPSIGARLHRPRSGSA